MYSIKKLATTTALYGISSVLPRIVNHLLVPLYTRVLLPADYGVITEYYAYVAFLHVLYTYGMEATYFRFARQHTTPDSFHIATSILLLSSLLFSSLLVLWATPITAWIAQPGCERYIYYFATILTIDTLLAIPFARLRLHNKALTFTSAKLLQSSLNILINLLFLYLLPKIVNQQCLVALHPLACSLYTPTRHPDYVFLANLIASASLLPLFSKSFLQLQFKLSWKQLQPMLVYTAPLLVTGLAGTINEVLSRASLRHLLPPNFYPNHSNETILGSFGACYKLAALMRVGVQSFWYAADPFFFAAAKNTQAPILFRQVMHGFILTACLILVALSANLDIVAYLLNNATYQETIEIVPYLSLSYLFLGISYNCSIGFKLVNKTRYIMKITCIGALVTILLNSLLVPVWGYWGSVWASLTSYVTMSSLSYYWGQKQYPIPYQRRGLLYIFVTIGLIYSMRHIPYTRLLHTLLANWLLMLLFALLLYYLERKKRVHQKQAN